MLKDFATKEMGEHGEGEARK